MPFDLQGPTFDGSFSFPEQLAVTMQLTAIPVVLRAVITQEAEIKKIARSRQKFERREITLVERASIGPDPADPMLFQQANELRLMPARVAELNRKTKIGR